MATLVPGGDDTSATAADLDGLTLLYVGGRAHQIPQLRKLVELANGHMLHHDGGLEHNAALLPGLVSRADLAVFPVDCISHEAMAALKRTCRQLSKPYVPLRTASLASLLAGRASNRGPPAHHKRWRADPNRFKRHLCVLMLTCGPSDTRDPMAATRLTVRVDFGADRALGPGKIRLLEAVKNSGSISQAGRSLDMSYRRAWLLIDDMNRCFREPVVAAQPGGAQGGGAALTAFGEQIIETYRAIEGRATAAAKQQLRELETVLRARGRPAINKTSIRASTGKR